MNLPRTGEIHPVRVEHSGGTRQFNAKRAHTRRLAETKDEIGAACDVVESRPMVDE